VAALGEFEPGAPRQRLAEFGGIKIGSAICYESIFPNLFAGDSRAGADLYVNITNDGWYLDTAAPYQHFNANIFRAVETRRSVVRAANNGISGVLRAAAPVYVEQAFFPAYGHWVAGAALLLVLAFLLALLFA
jgi:apolipoprotein N-acyltransferase